MTHWELEACSDAFREKHAPKSKLTAPTDEEFDNWVEANAAKKSRAA